MTEAIILGLISSGALATVVTAIINTINNRKGRLANIEAKLTAIEANQRLAEKDSLRTQLLLMIADYPREEQEIMKLAEHYFKDLHGDWYATSIFNKWLERDASCGKPEWFRSEVTE